MKLRIIMLAVVLSFFVPIVAHAEDKDNYFALKSGMRAFRSDLRDANLDIGFDGEVVYGRYFGRNFAIEVGTGYFHDGVNKGYGNDIKGWPATLTAKGIYPVGDFELFAGVGPGVYFARFHGMVNGKLADANDTLFGGHVLGGANYNISSRFFVGIEGKYIVTDKGDFDVLKATLNGYTLTASLGFRF